MRKLSAWMAVLVLGLVTAISVVVNHNRHHAWSPFAHPASSPLRVGYAIEPPCVLLDAQGHVGGESAELLRAALQHMGEAEPVWLHFEFANLIEALQAGHIDLIAAGMVITPAPGQQVAFTRPIAHMRTGQPAFAMRPDDPRLGRLDQALAGLPARQEPPR